MLDIAIRNVFRQKSRSVLTILGIAIGIGLILGLGSIGEGLNQQMQQSFGNVGAVIDVRDSSNPAAGIPQYPVPVPQHVHGEDAVLVEAARTAQFYYSSG